MIIKSSKEYRIIVAMLLCVAIVFFFILMDISNYKDLLFPSISAIIIIFIIIQFWISVDRTLMMDKNGCTVKFFCYEKTYKWSELKIKSIENCTYGMGYRIPYTSCVVFSKKQKKNPSWLKPSMYSMFANPFSFFYVYFEPRINYGKLDYRCPNIYVVDEDEFRKKMTEWNVELKDNR